MTITSYQLPGAPHLALLSDLHGRPFEKVLSCVRSHGPSLICIPGDLIAGSWPEEDISPLAGQPQVLRFLSGCAAIAPSFLSLGNHELDLDEEDLGHLRETGVTVLDNEFCSCFVEGRKILIGGLTSGFVTTYRKAAGEFLGPGMRYPHGEALEAVKDVLRESELLPDTSWLSSFASAEGFHLCLSHHPEYLPLIPSSIELILSGHAHGGQWRIGGRALYAPGQGLFPRWTRGLYEGRLIVSAGLSNTAPVPRIGNPTEVVFVGP